MDDEQIENELKTIKNSLENTFNCENLISAYKKDKPAFRECLNDLLDSLQRDEQISEHVAYNAYLCEELVEYNEISLRCDSEEINL